MKTYIQLLSTVYFFHYIFSHEKQIAIKEGDGDRLFDKYKMALLLYIRLVVVKRLYLFTVK